MTSIIDRFAMIRPLSVSDIPSRYLSFTGIRTLPHPPGRRHGQPCFTPGGHGALAFANVSYSSHMSDHRVAPTSITYSIVRWQTRMQSALNTHNGNAGTGDLTIASLPASTGNLTGLLVFSRPFDTPQSIGAPRPTRNPVRIA